MWAYHQQPPRFQKKEGIMDIRKNVRDAHRQLSNCSVKFLEYVEQEPELLKRSGFKVLDEMAEVGKLQSWPTFINQHTKDRMKDAGTKVFDLIRLIPGRIFQDDVYKMSEYYQLPAEIVKIQLDGTNAGHLENILARADFFFSPSGLKCLEYNVSANLGGMQVSYWEPMYANFPVISKFLNKYNVKIIYKNVLSLLLGHLLKNALNIFPTSESEINIAVAFPGGKQSMKGLEVQSRYMDKVYRELLHCKPGHIEGEVIFCDYPDLKIADGFLFHKHKKIHVLMEMYHGVVFEEIMAVFKKGNLCLFNGPVTKLLSNKLNLALLSEHEHSDKFSPAERDIIKKYIPWTRRITGGVVTYENRKVKLEDFIFSNKEKMVIKPPMGMSGSDIYIGKNTPAAAWQKVVERAFNDKNWLLQEYIDSFSYLYQTGENGCAEHKAVWGIFIFGSQYAGGWVRVLHAGNKSGVINSIQGAEETVVIEVDEPGVPADVRGGKIHCQAVRG
jgi:hypothetical protein